MTWVTNPSSVKQWLNFQAIMSIPEVDGVAKGSVGFRLGDGTNQKWWSGTAWVTNTVNWNTEAEIATNIGTFPVASRQMQVIINLKSNDAKYTPEVEKIKVLYASDVEFQDDLINRSLIPALRTKVRPIADFPVSLAASGATINIKTTYQLETPYNVVGIDSVFNHTDDPAHLADLYSSYNPTTGDITLTTSIAAGKVAWIRFYYEPEVAVNTSQDYSEIEKIPSIILSEISLVEASETGQDDSVISIATGAGTKVPGPLQGDLEITAQLLTDKARDQQMLADEVKRFFADNPLIRSKGMDEEYRLWLVDEYAQQTTPTQDEIHTGRLRFRIAKALFFQKQTVDVYSVKQFHLTWDMDAVVSNQPEGD
jgi:methylglyoxal synthase